MSAGGACPCAPPNTLVLFEGAKVPHKVSPILEGERRVVVRAFSVPIELERVDPTHGREPPRPLFHSRFRSSSNRQTTDLAPEDEWDAIATDFGLLAERLRC